MKTVLIAYSGGVDSTLLLKIAKETLGDNVFAVTAKSETYPEKEYIEAKRIAEKLKVKHTTIHTKELNNPYLAIRTAHTLQFNKYNSQLLGYFRFDQELFLPSISAAIENTDFLNQWRIEIQSDIYFQFDQKIGNFWENQIRGYLNHTINNQNRFYTNSQIRYKHHFSSDSLYGNVFLGDINIADRYYFQFLSWIELNLRPSIYNETRSLGLQYLHSQVSIDFNHRAEYNNYIQFRLNFYFRNFINKQFTNDYTNKYFSLIPTLVPSLR